MASNTENLNLLMKNPSTDGADTFNVQTMLNENWQKIDNNAGTVAQTLANILKPTTPPIIGLPPSTTPDGMFQALGNTGELHVWRKTVKNAADVPAGYNLGTKTTKTILNTNDNSHGSSAIYYSSSVSVSDSGTVSLKNPTTTGVDIYTSSLPIVGKFFYIDLSSVQTSDLIQKKIYFVPSGTTISVDDSPKAFSGIVQEVTGYAKIPAGTTTTYPVSTNPKAYQEGDDAKAAGYTLGDVVKGNFELAYSANYPRQFNVAESVTVDEAGNITLNSPVVYSFYTNSNGNSRDLIKGKFVTRTDNSPPWVKDGAIYYIPTDAVISYVSTWYEIDRYQPVTGYAAIPAGTTIEYLGKLGDKARVQFGSYVGTGTYGSSNPNALTFDFVPKMVFVWGFGNSSGNSLYYQFMFYGENYTSIYIGDGNSNSTKVSWDSKTVSWYHNGDRYQQLNESSRTYRFFAIG